jgi:outer membrane protein assembly factor BamE
LLRVEGDAAVADAGELNVPVNKSRLIDLGSLSGEAADTPLPPREPPGFFRRLMNMLGF